MHIIQRSLALAALFCQNNQRRAKHNVLFLDLGYSHFRLSLVHIGLSSIELLASKTLELGLRDFDFEVYKNILREVNQKYLVNY